ncbi:MAG: type V CRISPR-associated protein Cas12k [Waterburya sp.]
MSQITIQCRLVASETTRQLLWKLMAEKNTPLINEILWQINNHPDFEQWQSQGKLPTTIVSELCKSLKTHPLYAGQSSRFYASAIKLVNYIYKSWLKLQQRRQRKLEGQERWLSMLKSDTELLKECECSLDILRKRAKEILTKVEAASAKSKKKSDKQNTPKKSSLLFALYDETEEEDILTRSVICYLLKNGSKLPQPDKPEDGKKFAQRRRKAAIRIKRLQEQIEGSRPHGRDLTGEQWLETLIAAATQVPEDEREARTWQDILLTKRKSLPFPITIETIEDLKWHTNEKGRLCVRFIGLSKHTFQIYCDRRQLHWFQRFLEDQTIKKEGKDMHSSGLFTLRSAQLAWKQDKERGEPWNANRLVLYCTVDTRFWSAEGTQQARQEKEAKLLKTLEIMKEKGELSPTQQAFVQKKLSTLAKFHNSFPRPSRKLYQGKPKIILGVSMGLDKPATVAIVDGETGDTIVFRSIKQLLGKDYRLLNRQRQQKQALSHLRHKAQKRSDDNQKGESNLGEYVDRLIAKSIVELAQQYQVSAIIVPKIEDMREIVQSEIKAKAEAKIPGYEEGQKKYAKQYRINIHNWSYGRLIENITTQASKLGIAITEIKQPVRGSPTEKARDVAIAFYNKKYKS